MGKSEQTGTCDGCHYGDELRGGYHVVPAGDGLDYWYPCTADPPGSDADEGGDDEN